MTMRVRRIGIWLLCVAVVSGCVRAPPRDAGPAYEPATLVAAIRAAGAASTTELDVQPLRDPETDDLREQATRLEQHRMYRGAADLLDRAIDIQPEDPALLQERAEIALLLRDPGMAEQLAARAIELGSTTGPLCRRHWETRLQTARLRANDRIIRDHESEAEATRRVRTAEAEVRAARASRDACTVAAPDRF